MAVTKTTKPKKTATTAWQHKRLIKLALVVVLAIAILLQLRFDWYVYSWARPGRNTDTITTLIVQALRSVNKPAVIEPISKKVYLPDANLVLPSPSQDFSQGLLYNYSPSIDGTDAEASVTLTSAINVATSRLEGADSNARAWSTGPSPVFNEVVEAQACARGVHLVFGSKTKYDTLVFTKQLADGRTMRIYTEHAKCAYNLEPLASYLEQAQSY